MYLIFFGVQISWIVSVCRHYFIPNPTVHKSGEVAQYFGAKYIEQELIKGKRNLATTKHTP
jgi:hypothetical protein